MNAPAVVIRLELEGAPVVYVDALYETETVRLNDWLEHHAAYADLVARAMALAEEARAA